MITKPLAKTMQEEALALLQDLSRKYGCVAALESRSTIERDGSAFQMGKVKFTFTGGAPVNPNAELERAWNTFAEMEGLKVEWLGTSITIHSLSGTLTGKILGYDTRAKKYPVIIQTAAGKRYKLTPESIKANKRGNL